MARVLSWSVTAFPRPWTCFVQPRCPSRRLGKEFRQSPFTELTTKGTIKGGAEAAA